MLNQEDIMLKSIVNFFKIDKKTALLILFILCFKSFAYNPSYVPTGSMIPTIDEKALILVDVHAYGVKIPFTKVTLFENGKPERGDIAVFRKPGDEGTNFIKRIVAIPGDTIYYNEEKFTVNEVPKNMPNMHRAVIPTGSYFAIGDNILNSYDSRYWGYVPEANLVGKYVGTIAELKSFIPKGSKPEFNQEQKDLHKQKEENTKGA